VAARRVTLPDLHPSEFIVMMHITFIGGGNMATAIIAGLTKARGCQISVVEPNADKRAQLAQQFGVTTQEQLPVYFGSGQIVVLAVKPQQLREVCGGLASRLDGALVLSIAAGVGVSALSRWLDGHERIVRIMPNTPAMIGKGVAGLFDGFEQRHVVQHLRGYAFGHRGRQVGLGAQQRCAV